MDLEQKILEILKIHENRWFMIYEIFNELYKVELNKINEIESNDRIWEIVFSIYSLYKKDEIEMTIVIPQKELRARETEKPLNSISPRIYYPHYGR